MTEAASRTPGPGSGPGGVPVAIALTPILAARWRGRDLDAIRAAAPGARIVTIGFDGHPDGHFDDVEVMLRGRFPAERSIASSPGLRPCAGSTPPRRAWSASSRLPAAPGTSPSPTRVGSSRAPSPST